MTAPWARLPSGDLPKTVWRRDSQKPERHRWTTASS